MPRDAEVPRMAGARGTSLRPLRDRGERQPRIPELLSLGADDLRDCVCRVLESGCAILLGATSDGGAISVTLYDGDQRWREYASTPGEFKEVLQAIEDHVDARLVGAIPKPAPTQQPRA